MNRTLAGFAYVTGFLLALTVEVNAIGVVALDRQSPMGENRALRMAQAQPSEHGKMFRGVGIVTAIESAGSLTINHEPIAGLMPAMEMTFSVNPRALTNGVRAGDKVEFSMDGRTYIIHELKVVGHDP
jgi:Cu/Ag efflux protein CusF